MDNILFPISSYWWFYIIFTFIILFILLLDLGIFHRKAHIVGFKEASIWTTVWIIAALIFNYAFYQYCIWKFTNLPEFSHLDDVVTLAKSKEVALEFLTGYVVEKTLAIDNIFIFAIVFSYFKIAPQFQHKVLFWGILGAMIFRAIFIALGSVLMQYQFIVIFFGLLLILTGVKLFFAASEHPDLSKNIIIKMLNKIFNVRTTTNCESFFIKENNRFYVTPLFIALIFIEISDIIFAIDSVPAIFALTDEPFIVYTSNIFAILGLRSLYFMISGSLEKFTLIKYGLAGVLVFVGLKMVYLNDLYGGKFPISWSLAVITCIIGASIIASIIHNRLAKK